MRNATTSKLNTVVVPLGELRVSADPSAQLITYALGSCLGISVYDPVARVGGLLHAMLPRSDINAVKAQQQPSLFVESGIPALFRACYACGGLKERLIVRIAGASVVTREADDQFEIGKRNLLMARQLFWHNNVFVRGQDVGGNESRTMSLHVGSGEVVIRKRAGSFKL